VPPFRMIAHAAPLVAVLFASAHPAAADDRVLPAPTDNPLIRVSPLLSDASASAPDIRITDAAPVTGSPASPVATYFNTWFDRVDQARANQPHWASPLFTTTPLLIEQVRGDVYFERVGNGAQILNLGGGKGLELIPTTTNEITIPFPSYQERYNVKPATGFTDWQFLLVKQRLLSANEQNGNYVVTAFLSAQAPIGVPQFSNNAYVITPTLAAGKGFGNFDIQATTSLAVPTSHRNTLGLAWATNITLQYRVGKLFWPEVEMNWTHWLNGTQRGGKDQVFMTVGAVIGPVRLTDRLSIAIGAGYQFAVAPPLQLSPVITPVYDHNWVVSVRMPF
jgi:hypothetical protein